MTLSAEAKNRLMAEMPAKIGKYEITEILGRGAMGVVYLGYDPFADRKVAVKVSVIPQEDEHTAQIYRRMFFNEAHMAGLLEHPNILSVYDAGVEGDSPYMVMEYVEDARTLKEYCGVDKLPPIKTVVEIAFKCARALDYAHRTGVIHRDIKPTNILFTKHGDVKIADFGIAKRTHSETTQVLGMIGSPRYMSPEQALEEEVDNQTDLFSLGVVIYELLTGKRPFAADGFSRLLYKIIHDEPTPLEQHRSDVPEPLRKIVMKCMQKDLAKRYKTGAELAADLARTFEDLGRVGNELNDEEKFATVKRLSFFRSFTEPEIWEVIRAATWEQHPADSQIIAEGTFEQSFYIIAGGSVRVEKNKQILGGLDTGDCFGEMGYLTKAMRTATIVAEDEVDVLKVNSTLIEQASMGCQLKFLKVFLRTLIERLTHTNEALTNH